MRFARWVFRLAGIYGILVLTPQYFLLERLDRDFPPPVTHPELFYGFLGVTLAWQVAYLIIATDPPRYRPIMLAGILGKLLFVAAVFVLYSQGRVATAVLAASIVDLAIAVLFAIAFFQCGQAAAR
jgi:hypothetical protein